MSLTLRLLPNELTIIRLPPDLPVPSWYLHSGAAPLSSITRTASELSIVCPSSASIPDGLKSESGWRALVVDEKLEFSAIGILSAILNPLAAAGINILSISTFDTDYVLVPATLLPQALAAVRPHFNVVP